MGMKPRDDMRRALAPAAQAMSRAIHELRELGHDDAADDLKAVFDQWVATANRGVRRVSPRGRAVVPPMVVPLPLPSRPPVGVEEWARYVPLLRAQHAPRKQPVLRLIPLRNVRSDAEVLDAG